MEKHQLIVNPVAGRGAAERMVPEIETLLRGHGLDFDLVRTERPWQAADLARRAAVDGYAAVVAVGGDGTANEVLNGLMWARLEGVECPAMGVLCIGRGNDFAYGVGIPADIAMGCRTLAAGQRRQIDVGRVTGGLYPQGRYFGNGVGIGFDAVVGFEAVKMTRLHGFPSYIVAALKTIFLYYNAPLVTLQYEDQEITHPALMVSVMNGRRMGGGFMMAPAGHPADGLFDLCVAHEVSRARIFSLILHFMRGTQAGQPAIYGGRTRRIVVTAVEGVLPAHADGETLCVDGRRLELELLPLQLEVICPPETAI